MQIHWTKRGLPVFVSIIMSGSSPSGASSASGTRKIWKRKTTKEFEELKGKLRKRQRQNLKDFKGRSTILLTKYPKQHMAITAADDHNASWRGGTIDPFCPSRHRLFSLELATTGKRTFFSCSISDFWKMYMNAAPKHRHHYEIIRAGFPCRLYFDCEFYKEFNPALDVRADGTRMVSELIRLAATSLQMLFGIMVTREAFLVLDSSTHKKCSFHIIVHLPKNQLFKTNIHVGKFVRWLAESCRPPCSPGGPAAALPRFSNLWVNGRKEKKEFFADEAVYTKNRAFRLLYSSKFGKVQTLLPSMTLNKFKFDNFTEPGEYQLFLDALICASLSIEEELGSTVVVDQPSLIVCDHILGARGLSHANHRATVHRPVSLAATGSVAASRVASDFNSWTTTHRSHRVVLENIMEYLTLARNIIIPTGAISRRVGDEKTYVIATRSKDCKIARRRHRSNHIWFVVDMGLRTLVQHCHDEDCRRSHYAMAVPGEIFQSLPADKKEAVGGQALQVGRKVETEKNN